MIRTEEWTLDGRTAMVDVEIDPFDPTESGETVVVSYKLLAQMLTEIGFVKKVDDDE